MEVINENILFYGKLLESCVFCNTFIDFLMEIRDRTKRKLKISYK